MTQKKTLYLHIGLPKTGSTSIQNYLFNNRFELQSRGVLYPEPLISVGHHAEALMILRENHPDIKFPWHRPATDVADKRKGTLPQLIRNIDISLSGLEVENQKLIISSEGIFEAFQAPDDIKLFPAIFQEYTIRLIFYVRRIDRIVCSAILEHIKVHEPISDLVIENNKTFRINQQLQIVERLKKWGELIGEENVIVRPFERRQLKGGDVVTDFMNMIDPSIPVPKSAGDEQNVGISVECAYFMAETLTYPAWKRSALEADIGAIIISSDKLRNLTKYEGSLLSPTDRVALIQSLDSTYKALARCFLGRQNGKLFYDPLPEISDHWEPFDGLSIYDMRIIYDEIINVLYRRIEHYRKIADGQGRYVKKNDDTSDKASKNYQVYHSLSFPLIVKALRLFFVDNKEFRRLLKRRLAR